MTKRNQTPPTNFEDAVAELEQILGKIEGGELGLEDSLLHYERGSFLIQYCRGVLNSAEKQIEEISTGSDGSLQARPIEQPNTSIDSDPTP